MPIPPSLLPFLRWWIRSFLSDPVTGTVDQGSFLCPTVGFGSDGMAYVARAWTRALLTTGLPGSLDEGAVGARLDDLRRSYECDISEDALHSADLVGDICGHRRLSAGRSHRWDDRGAGDAMDFLELAARVDAAILRSSSQGDIIPQLMKLLMCAQGTSEHSSRVSTTEAAAALGISDQAVRRMVRAGVLSADVVRQGKRRSYSISVSQIANYRSLRVEALDRQRARRIAAG